MYCITCTQCGIQCRTHTKLPFKPILQYYLEFEFIGSSIKYIHDSIYTLEKKSCKTYMFSDYRLLAITSQILNTYFICKYRSDLLEKA